jgi:hypothetical protein
MNRFAVSLLIMFMCFATACRADSEQAPVRQDMIVYYVPVNYDNAHFKKQALVQGVYYYSGRGIKNSIETQIEQTNIKYNTDFSYKQQDIVFVYSAYAPGEMTRAGLHFARTSTVADDGMALFFGSARHKPDGGFSRFDVYVSKYDGYSPNVMVYQISPAIGRTIYKSNGSSLYLQTRGYYIHPTKQIGNNARDFFSVGQTISFTKRNVTAGISAWTGRQVFAVRNDGFVMYNSAEVHKGGYGASISYNMPNQTKLTLFAGKEAFSDFGYDNSAASTQIGVSAGRTF